MGEGQHCEVDQAEGEDTEGSWNFLNLVPQSYSCSLSNHTAMRNQNYCYRSAMIGII